MREVPLYGAVPTFVARQLFTSNVATAPCEKEGFTLPLGTFNEKGVVSFEWPKPGLK